MKGTNQPAFQKKPSKTAALPANQPPTNKTTSGQSFGNSAKTIMPPPQMHSQQSFPVRRRESKKVSQKYMSAQSMTQQQLADLLEKYNDMKALQESKELPTRQVFLRRIGLKLVKIKATNPEGGASSKKRSAAAAE